MRGCADGTPGAHTVAPPPPRLNYAPGQRALPPRTRPRLTDLAIPTTTAPRVRPTAPSHADGAPDGAPGDAAGDAAGDAVGDLLRRWRARRQLSQLALALEGGVSQRHLSFVETGRARPSRELLLRLAEHLRLPLRERNRLLVAAGFAPEYRERPLDDVGMAAARAAVERVLHGHLPYPALAVDRHWTLLAANAAVAPLLVGVAPALLAPPANVLRLSLHPDGLAPRIENLAEWRAHLLHRLLAQIEASGDATLAALHEELARIPTPDAGRSAPRPADASRAVFVPLRLRTPHGVLSFLSTTTVFGTPVDVTLAELALECFFPADAETAEALRGEGGR